MLYVLKIWDMLQYTFIFNTVRTEILFTFIIILFVFLSHPIKIYHLLSCSTTPFFYLTISSLPHSFLLPFALFCFAPPSFSLPYSLQLPFYHHWSIKIRFTSLFFPFSPFFLALSSLFYDLIYRIGSSSQSCRFAVQSEPPPIYSLPSHKFHHQLTIKSPSPVIFPPFSPFFFALSPLFLWSHTPNRFSRICYLVEYQGCDF